MPFVLLSNIGISPSVFNFDAQIKAAMELQIGQRLKASRENKDSQNVDFVSLPGSKTTSQALRLVMKWNLVFQDTKQLYVGDPRADCSKTMFNPGSKLRKEVRALFLLQSHKVQSRISEQKNSLWGVFILCLLWIYSFFIRILFCRPRLHILIFLPILGWK